MKNVLIATTNKGKLRELSQMLADVPLTFLSLADVGIVEEPEENGKSYIENSQIKALFYSKASGLPAIADDGGLEIEALDGAPGVKSRRWLGPDTTEKDLIIYMKKIAESLPDDNRIAYFTTVVSLAFPDGRLKSFSGKVEGIIAKKPSYKFEIGYPYRSFFYMPKLGKYFFEDEFSEKEMKLYNHRYKAIQKLKKLLFKEIADAKKA